MRKINRKNTRSLGLVGKSYYSVSDIEVTFFTDSDKRSVYARARSQWSSLINDWIVEEWWLVSKKDIQSEIRKQHVINRIHRFFGFFDFND